MKKGLEVKFSWRQLSQLQFCFCKLWSKCETVTIFNSDCNVGLTVASFSSCKIKKKRKCHKAKHTDFVRRCSGSGWKQINCCQQSRQILFNLCTLCLMESQA